ncbi:hypothetical protein [Prosthecobacter sp.]|uniref:hypothetical protein n=1 Tax=Prosthecobacter sp. TaxID=1965333 RepID=UPI00378417AE
MNVLTKSTPLGTLGLASGDHWVRFHVEGDAISFEVTASTLAGGEPPSKKPTGFVQKWSGSARRVEDPNDAWLTHINDKHLRGS